MRAERNGTSLGDGGRKILEAAEGLFADRGFEAVSMQAIAHAAGVCKANIYHYFPDKNALYLAVLRSASENLRALLQEAMETNGSVPEILHQFARGHLQALLDRPRWVRLVWREILEKGAPRSRELAEQGFGELFGTLVRLIERGQRCGELRSGFDPALAATLLIAGNVFFFQHQDVLRHYPAVTCVDAPETFARALVNLLLLGIGSSP
ncbi:TetR/AcrR family transcriptional regulator [Acidithiobacillus caldus]|jgi:TetR/AcrR family transcriptional regulator|uniref:Transcriptional regulator, TetR family n=1 Tax=Acidithiobacillus caldus (strain ATCC 51756 / DSM 8584 / KU) TaxID=637389 RepID=A0A059ZZM3_ACICK|nr:TetR/AcrR family transcriptional regulator [Acidithiobacillus caldus]AIA55466.1 Transcriptional regulator, TetR family [Acidithiobacillus caldus ATCC 51756]MBU2730206.1 TetR/AcrR family transcriptional regulator [Acidithiobacillus caldus]MBU2734832.1 TetR/AcrR family transcriptional regulator [Acidithiobacillus caldus ATCC 51756]MBU2745615.1 TetR/AcrR family transcriptional regulator [Acidithiobacillus caldus]MBU2763464.1 TetR/AcrR family transcriptional regulator [Acidithiobacillus caldus]